MRKSHILVTILMLQMALVLTIFTGCTTTTVHKPRSEPDPPKRTYVIDDQTYDILTGGDGHDFLKISDDNLMHHPSCGKCDSLINK